MNHYSYLVPAYKGLLKTGEILYIMAKIIVPVTFLIITLEKLELLVPVSKLFHPFLQAFGLPGEAALPLLLGFFINIYASISAMAVLNLSPQEVTVIALMLLTSHSLFMEAPILKFTGLSPLHSLALRIGGAFLFGFVLNFVYSLGG